MPKREKSFLTCIFVFLFCQTLFSYGEVVDKVAVIINDEIITQGEIDRILLPLYEKYKVLYDDRELAERLNAARQNLLENIIQDKLLLGEARRKKVEVDEKEVGKKIEEVRKRFSSEEEFKQALAEEDLVLNELTKKYRERLMIDKVIDMEINNRVSISPHEVIDYYENHKDEIGEPGKAKTRSILIRTGEGRSREEAIALAKEILGRLKEGGDFALLAQQYSNGPHAESGGDMGLVKEGELMEKIDALVFNLKKNEISDILETKLGFHIFKVEETFSPQPKGFREVKDQIEQILYQKKVNEKLGLWIKQLKRDAYIAFR